MGSADNMKTDDIFLHFTSQPVPGRTYLASFPERGEERKGERARGRKRERGEKRRGKEGKREKERARARHTVQRIHDVNFSESSKAVDFR